MNAQQLPQSAKDCTLVSERKWTEQEMSDLTLPLSSDVEKFNRAAMAWGLLWKECDLSITQVRRFYSEVKRTERLVREKGWDQSRLSFYMIKPKIAYALKDTDRKGKKSNFKEKVEVRRYQALFDYLTKYIANVTDKETFETFCLHFEATLGYAVGAGLKERETKN